MSGGREGQERDWPGWKWDGSWKGNQRVQR